MNEPENKHFEVYCKDCKHCIISDGKDDCGENSEYLRFEDCPISGWFESVWFVDYDFYENGYICDLGTLQPPPGCNCFEPREAK